ncbi:MAG: hypothetical protein V1489_00370, partial [Candidatus Liptonbacteria bacterium]
MELSSIDARWFETLRFFNILENVCSDRLRLERGVILVGCGDGDQFDDLYGQLARVNQCWRLDSRIHPCTRNGGAPRLVSDSPLNRHGRTV